MTLLAATGPTWAQQAVSEPGAAPTAQQSAPETTAPPQQPKAAPVAPRPADQAEGEVGEALKALEALKLKLDQVEAALQREGLTDRELAEQRARVDAIRQQILDAAARIRPRLDAVEARIRQLGPPPGEGQPPESEVIAAERAEQNALKTRYESVIIQARVLGVRAEQLSARITDRRRALFADRIFERQRSALNPTLWYDAFAAIPTVIGRLWLLLSEWGGSLRHKADTAMVLTLAGAFIAAAAALLSGRRRLLRLSDRDPTRTQPSELQKSTAAAMLTLGYLLAPAVALAIAYFVLQFFGLLPARVERLANRAVFAILFYSLGQGLAWAYLAPTRPTWRLVGLDDAPARRVLVFVLVAVAVFAANEFLDTVNQVLFAPLSVAIAKDVAASILIAASIGLVLIDAQARHDSSAGPSGRSLWWPRIIRLLWLVVIAIPIAALLGYLSLANFIASQMIVSGMILAVLVLLLKLCDSFFSIGLRSDGPLTNRLADSLAISTSTLSQLATLLNGAIRVALVLLALALLAVPWGFETKDIFSSLRTAFFGFTVGDLRISFSAILFALVVFLFGVLVTRGLQRWLDQRFLPQTRLDAGVRNSLRTTFGYLGIILSGVVGFAYMGLDLSNLAIVAGALSVGVGFGLQSIVNNFVSGLILLAERPIKTGDWIVVGTEEGYVRRISVRSTEIETFDQATVIVPNSSLITGMVKNWMHGNLLGRLRIPVGVAYNSNPEQVREILLRCAEEHPTVLRDPEPYVLFSNFGTSSLDFELRVFVAQVDVGLTVRSDLRFAILKAFREAGIEIPFPQQDLNLRSTEGLEAALDRLSAGRGPDGGPQRAEGSSRGTPA